MLQVARENLRALGLSNVELRQGRVDHLPLASDEADATVANMVLHHAPDPQQMVAEMVRVTRPGGRVVIMDLASHTHEWFRVEMADVWLGFTEPQVRQYLQAAGLTEIELGWVGTQCCAKSAMSVDVAGNPLTTDVAIFWVAGTKPGRC
ncbi:MAG TPA: methyltransferase domain-containing protein [Chloroflexia bacterium]|nr:methyltransferase domain-containing protein [Chloroflexia bacterium]